jgi:hypothetical protein
VDNVPGIIYRFANSQIIEHWIQMDAVAGGTSIHMVAEPRVVR